MFASSSILVNGSPTKSIKLQRGLCQGDPFSPFLFVLVVETLNLVIQKAIGGDLWEGVESSPGGMNITNLQYADDTIILCPPKIDYFWNIKKALIIFHLASGLEINFYKSSLIGVNVSSSWI